MSNMINRLRKHNTTEGVSAEDLFAVSQKPHEAYVVQGLGELATEPVVPKTFHEAVMVCIDGQPDPEDMLLQDRNAQVADIEQAIVALELRASALHDIRRLEEAEKARWGDIQL